MKAMVVSALLALTLAGCVVYDDGGYRGHGRQWHGDGHRHWGGHHRGYDGGHYRRHGWR